MKKYRNKCRICGGTEWSVLYQGPIRMGKFNEWSEKNHIVWKCDHCNAGFLNRKSIDYKKPDYRIKIDGDESPERYYLLHDIEQAEKLGLLGLAGLRGKVIMDIGSGAGSFLDLVKLYASKTIAVEPTESYHQALTSKGHKVYHYCDDALVDLNAHVDIAVSFATIEHVENPLDFLRKIKAMLKATGFLLLSTPNAEDWLIDFLPGVYDRFFFRHAHTWYFNEKSLQYISQQAGFSSITIKHIQQYDISNALYWTRDHLPTGIGKTALFNDMDAIFKKTIEHHGKSNFIYAWLQA